MSRAMADSVLPAGTPRSARPGHRAGGGAAAPWRYAALIVLRITVQGFLVGLLITGIFIGEKFTAIVDAALHDHGDIHDVLMLLPLAAPEILDLALPIATLIAVYRVALRVREDRELVVLAGTGVGAHQFLVLALFVGLLAQGASLVISGAVEPHARFAHRAIVFAARHAALSGGGATGEFYFFPNDTVFARLPAADGHERVLFVHRPEDTDIRRMIIARRAELEAPAEKGWVTLNLSDTTSYDFPAERPASDGVLPAGNASAPLFSMRIQSFARDLKVDQLFRFPPRGEGAAEWTLAELTGLAPAPGRADETHASEAARRVFRSFLGILAPLIGLVALAFTRRATLAVALPAACAALMAVDIVGTTAARVLAPESLTLAFLLPETALLAAALLLAWAIPRIHQGLVSPGLAKT